MGRSRLAALALLVALAGCGGGRQNTLDAHSKASHTIAHLFWIMVAGAGVVFGVVSALLLVAFLRRRSQDAPQRGSTQLTVQVTGHQWWWEVRYPGSAAVTANELHIPVRTRVDVVVQTADVIHSFWVPELNKKVDLIPGRTNSVLLYTDAPGVYRGQCAEFCGLQHAHMSMIVVAQSAAAFRAWLAAEGKPATAPAPAAFLRAPCAGCHTIRGTPAHGVVGPDLTHLGSRQTLAANTLPNTPERLREWILEPQHAKPGNRMPPTSLGPSEVDQLVPYLEGLK